MDLRARRAGVVNWPRALSPAALTAGVALLTVTIVTGFVSYTHICALTLVLHQSWKTAHLMPFAVDGQIVVGSVVFLVARGRTAWWGWLGIVPGLAESLFANWESGIAHGFLAAAWATVAAQAFAGSSFMFERWLKSQVTSPTATGPGTAANPHADDASATPGDIIPEVPHQPAPDEALQAFLGSAPDPVLALVMNVSRNKIRALRDRSAAAGAPDGEPGAPEPEPVRPADEYWADLSLNGSAPGA